MTIKTYSKKDFAWTKWRTADIKKLVPRIISHQKARYAEIKKIPKEGRTFQNTVYALESAGYEFAAAIKGIDILSMVSPINSVRLTAIAVLKELNKKFIEIEYDKGIYRALREYAESRNHKKEKLLPEEKKLLEDGLKGYKRMGFDLPERKFKAVKEIGKQLSRLASDFSKNLNEYKDFILVTKEELGGLPERFIAGLKKSGNKYRVTLEYPDIIPFMTHARNEKKRRELMDKNYQRGGLKNLKILEKAIGLRDRRAKILGYRNHAEFVLERRMAKTPKTVERFILGLTRKLRVGARKELEEVVALKKKITGDPGAKVFYYDSGFYAERLKEKKFKLHGEKIREYFPFERVVKGTFEIYQKLLGVNFKEIKDYPLWHEEVRLFAVREGGRIISYFLLDLYPRENKYGHACASEIVTGRVLGFRGNSYQAPLTLMITNFPKPRPGMPSLLSYGDVETFFHEFGHVMHSVLTKARYASQAGYNAAWDFVEAPSQMLENWTWNKKMIRLLSGHYKTKKPLPEKDMKNLLRLKNYLICRHTMRQLSLANFDFSIHTRKVGSLAEFARRNNYAFTGIHEPKSAIYPAGFGHLMGGYDAGYYGYLWSLVYASDMFTRFKKEGLLNKKTGRDYRKEILEVGSSREEIDSVRFFLGRNPNNRAFLREVGAK